MYPVNRGKKENRDRIGGFGINVLSKYKGQSKEKKILIGVKESSYKIPKTPKTSGFGWGP